VRALTIAAVLCVAVGVRAQTRLAATPNLSVAAGYDDNLFLDPALTGAAPPRADAVIDVHPSLQASLTRRGHVLALDADYLLRATPSNGSIHDVILRLAWRTPTWHRLQLTLAPLYMHYEATAFPDNTFELAGGDATLRLALGRVAIEAGYGADARAYTDESRNGQLDVDQQAKLMVRAQLAESVALETGYRFVDVASNDPTAVLRRHRVEAGLAWRPTWRFAWTAGYALWLQTLPNGAPPLSTTEPGGPRHDVAHAMSATITVRPLRWLDLFARYQLILSTSDQSNGRYQLDEVLIGVAAGWTFAREHAPSPPPLLPAVNGREVTFRARARPGARVGVVGDWNGWAPQPLAAVEGDRYETTLTLPPGHHAWALSIDGAVVTPPQASGFVDDGFGGKNAIVDVR
jgi:AMP-activated protein kinase-like protein